MYRLIFIVPLAMSPLLFGSVHLWAYGLVAIAVLFFSGCCPSQASIYILRNILNGIRNLDLVPPTRPTRKPKINVLDYAAVSIHIVSHVNNKGMPACSSSI